MPITEEAERKAYAVGQWLGGREGSRVRVLSGDTRRARETAAHLVRGMIEAGGDVTGPQVAFALRNPDLYVNGVRVDMVSSAQALAAQVDGLSPEDVVAIDFFPEFFVSPDRVGWWLNHENPPGEKADSIASRMRHFVASLGDPTPLFTEVVVAVTHSPLIRAVGRDYLGRDIGEPPWVSGLLLSMGTDHDVTVDVFDPEAA